MRETYLTNAPGEREDRYELTCEKWRMRFLEMDHEALAERFHLEQDEEALYIIFFNQRYRLDKKNGMITLEEEPERKLAFNTIISIYNLFYYALPEAKVKGEFVPFRQVKRAAPFDPAFQRTILAPLAKTFEGRADALDAACRALHGEPVRQGDVGYVIQAFECVPLTVIFWDGDDEFSSQSNILFDADITDFLHEETVVCVAAALVKRLAEEADLGHVEKLMGGDL